MTKPKAENPDFDNAVEPNLFNQPVIESPKPEGPMLTGNSDVEIATRSDTESASVDGVHAEDGTEFIVRAATSARQVVDGISDREQARIDTLEQQQGGRIAAQRSVLGARVPLTAEEIERAEVAAIIRQNELRKLQKKGPKSRGPRGKKSTKETGPSQLMQPSTFPPKV